MYTCQYPLSYKSFELQIINISNIPNIFCIIMLHVFPQCPWCIWIHVLQHILIVLRQCIFKTSSKFKYIHLETNSQFQCLYCQNLVRLVSNAFLLVCLQLIFLVYGLLQNLYRIFHHNLSPIYFNLRFSLLLIHIVHHTCYMSTFRLYRTVILFIMHFVRDVFNLTHLYTSIDLSKSLNTTPVNNYSYKTKNSINPLIT